MARLIERYWDDEIGSSTVDWIVLGAGILLLSAALIAVTLPADRDLAQEEGRSLTVEEA
jgi:hypothetical protein